MYNVLGCFVFLKMYDVLECCLFVLLKQTLDVISQFLLPKYLLKNILGWFNKIKFEA